MATRAEIAKSEAAKKGTSRHKGPSTKRRVAKVTKAPRTKRDSTALVAHEVVASSADARARRAKGKATRVRGKS